MALTALDIIRLRFIGISSAANLMNILDFGITAGNSARFIRNAIVPILACLIYELCSGDEFVNYNLPNNSDEYFIPVTLINGKGKVEITVYPNDNAKLDISNAEIVDTYDVIFSYCYARANKSTEGNKIYIDKNKENIAILEGVKELKVNDVTKKVINYEEDERYIQLELESEASEFAYPNVFEVIK